MANQIEGRVGAYRVLCGRATVRIEGCHQDHRHRSMQSDHDAGFGALEKDESLMDERCIATRAAWTGFMGEQEDQALEVVTAELGAK